MEHGLQSQCALPTRNSATPIAFSEVPAFAPWVFALALVQMDALDQTVQLQLRQFPKLNQLAKEFGRSILIS